MKLFSGWMISAGLVLSAAAANAQVLPPHPMGGPPAVVSDFEGPPYAAMPQDAPPPRDGYGYGYDPSLLPLEEVYAVIRENGFSPIGIPRQRGLIYTMEVVDRRGEDGRLLIDARTGQILRFILRVVPAGRLLGYYNPAEDARAYYGPAGPRPPVNAVRGPPRPPGTIPHVASRTPVVPTPKSAAPQAGDIKPEAIAKPATEPSQQSAAVQAKPPAPSTEATGSAKPVPQILPTQPMPKAQGLD